MTVTGKKPSAESILSTLVDLYAEQMGVKIKYQIETTAATESMRSNKKEECK